MSERVKRYGKIVLGVVVFLVLAGVGGLAVSLSMGQEETVSEPVREDIKSRCETIFADIKLQDEQVTLGSVNKLLTDYAGDPQIVKVIDAIAYQYRQCQQYEAAIELYGYVLQYYPDSTEAIGAQVRMGKSYLKLGDYKAAAAAVNNLLSDFSQDGQIAERAYEIAQECFVYRQYSSARQGYEYIIANKADSEYASRALGGLVKVNLCLEDEEAAMKLLDELLVDYAADPKVVEVINDVACQYRSLRRYDEAIGLYNYVLENYPDDSQAIWAQVRLVKSYVCLRQDEGVAGGIEKLLKDFAGDKRLFEAVCDLAQHCQDYYRYGQAQLLYQYVADNKAENKYAFEAAKGLIKAKICLGDEKGSQELLDGLSGKFAEDGRIVKVIDDAAGQYHDLGDDGRAIELYKYVLENYRDNKSTLWCQVHLVEACNSQPGQESVDDELERLLSDFKGHADLEDAVYGMGKYFYDYCRYGKVVRVCRFLMENYSEGKYGSRPLCLLARAHVCAGNYDEADAAVAQLQQEFSGDDYLSRGICEIAICYQQKGELEKAAKLYDYVSACQSGDRVRYAVWKGAADAMVAMCYGDDPNTSVILDDLCIKFTGDPELPMVLFDVAEYYFLGGQYDKAAERFGFLLEEYPGDGFPEHKVAYFAGICCDRLGDYQRAIKYYSKVADEYPDSLFGRRVLCRLGMLCRQQGDYIGALHWFDRQCGRSNQESQQFEEALFSKGVIYLFDLGEYQRAIKVFGQYEQLYPDNHRAPLALFNQAIGYEKLADRTEAIRLLTLAEDRYPGSAFSKDIVAEKASLREGNK
jgi:tetratricopeptide (TPR) repeat protein